MQRKSITLYVYTIRHPRATLCFDDYDCIGFDLDHTLCRYNLGPMIRLEYRLLADFLASLLYYNNFDFPAKSVITAIDRVNNFQVTKKGYDPLIAERDFDADRDLVCKGLTLDCERGNLLRLGCDGFILAACHGTK